MSRFQFVTDHRHAFQAKRLCQSVEVSRLSFYAWTNAAPGRAERAAADVALAAQIKAVQDPQQGDNRGYGAPPVTAEFNDGVALEDRVNHKRIARVMRTHHQHVRVTTGVRHHRRALFVQTGTDTPDRGTGWKRRQGSVRAGAPGRGLSLHATAVPAVPWFRLEQAARTTSRPPSGTSAPRLDARSSRPTASPTLAAPGAYELDHLIPLELGGGNAATNLWPEAHHGVGSASVKDQLENHLHVLVCSG